eukprot:TRINITY_DN7599_c0_g1_i1.p1 TRINITY_DN7599_c0_g1~~TRINITY_DN7599_c0_g1_i1.p1  ORF type:complete len:222 (-),score=51.26 TRINITY_DN7599_c0_g1_i1:130-708(-)
MALTYWNAIRKWGLRETVRKMYMVGEINFGDFKGADSNGNKYYENRSKIYGTHRWVEYADCHNYDSSTVTPEWHGWLHNMHDTPPDQSADPKRHELTSSHDDCPYDTHVGPASAAPVLHQNLSGFRPRGYGVGNLFQEWGEPELYYKQPGHPANPISDKGGRFNTEPEVEFADPNDPNMLNPKKPLRSLDEL